MAIAFVRNHTAGTSSSSGTTVTYTLAATVPAGNLIAVFVGYDNLTAFTPNVDVLSTTKQSGETASWVLHAVHDSSAASAAGGVRGELLVIQTTVPWSAATYTVTLSASVTRKIAVVSEFSGATATRRDFGGTGTSTSGVPTSTTGGVAPVAGDLVLGGAAFESTSVPTGDADTLNGSWSAINGVASSSGISSSSCSGGMQYKIVTAGGHQTYNPTGGSVDSGSCVIALVPVNTLSPVSSQDPLSITDSMSTDMPLIRDYVGDKEDLTDALFNTETTYIRTYSDNAVPRDSISRDFFRDRTDAENLTDANRRTWDYGTSESVGLADSFGWAYMLYLNTIGGTPKAWTGAAWEYKPFQDWNGLSWVQRQAKQWTGSDWVYIWPRPLQDSLGLSDYVEIPGLTITRNYSDNAVPRDSRNILNDRFKSDNENLTDVKRTYALDLARDDTGLTDTGGPLWIFAGSDTVGISDSFTAQAPPSPTYFAAKWTSATVNTLVWNDSLTPDTVYDIYYSDTVLSNWTTGTQLGSGIAPGVGTLTHNKSALDQKKSMLYYGIIGRTTGETAGAVVRGTPRERGGATWLPATIGPSDKAIQGLVQLTSAETTKLISFNIGSNVSIDWGDGATYNTTTPEFVGHTYTYATMGNEITGAVRQAMITITPKVGGQIVRFDSTSILPVEIIIGNCSFTTFNLSTTTCKYVSFMNTTIPAGTLFSASTGMIGVCGDLNISNINLMFDGRTSLKYLPNMNLAGCTAIDRPFRGCSLLQDMGEIKITNTSGVLSINGMFDGCVNLTKAPSFNTSACTDMYNMFYNCSQLQEMPDYNTGNCTNLSGMFYNCRINNAGSRTYDTSKCIDFGFMFTNCSFTTSPSLNTNLATRFEGLFKGCSNLATVNITSVANGTNFAEMFSGCSSLTTANLPAALTTGVGTGNGTDFSKMFLGCNHTGFTTIPLIDVSKGYSFASMFEASGVISIPALNTIVATDFSRMFYNCTRLTSAPITSTASASGFLSMFYNCGALTSVPTAFSTGNGTRYGSDLGAMFYACTSLTTMPLLDTRNATSFRNTFLGCNKLTSIPAMNTATVTDFLNAFGGCAAITTCDITSMAACTDAGAAFSGCTSLTAVPTAVTGTGLSNTVSLIGTFSNCTGLTTVPALSTGKVTSMRQMFSGCTNLVSVGAMTTTLVTNFSDMFAYCAALTGGIGVSTVAAGTDFSQMFKDCTSLTAANIPAALTTGGGTGNGTNFARMFNNCTNDGFTTIPLINTAKGLTFTGMFQGCSKLTSVPLLDTHLGTSFFTMFTDCTVLPAIPALNCSAGTSFGTLFTGCPACLVVGMTGMTRAISLVGCSTAMTAANIDQFYTNLGTAAGAQTVTVTGLTNQAASTKSIATAKGWTVSPP